MTQETIFDNYRNVDFGSFDLTFRRNLRLLTHFVQERGGIPLVTTTSYHGVDLGGWLNDLRANPHHLSPGQRCALRSVPGVMLSPTDNHPREITTPADRAYLWNRLKLWADNPIKDPVIQRQLAAMRRARLRRTRKESTPRSTVSPRQPETATAQPTEPARPLSPLLQED